MDARSDFASLDELRRLLQRARWRLRVAAVGGPEWDAATSAVEELEERLRRRARPENGRPSRG